MYFNTLSLLFPLVGHQLDLWWLDPVGAAILSLFIIYDWAETCLENVIRLSGSAADDRLLKKITFMAWRFAPVISAYKTITGYHAGDGIWVEVDIMLDKDTKLSKAHDIAETLQYCLEGELFRDSAAAPQLTLVVGLTEVDRAFVSVDCKSCLLCFVSAYYKVRFNDFPRYKSRANRPCRSLSCRNVTCQTFTIP